MAGVGGVSGSGLHVASLPLSRGWHAAAGCWPGHSSPRSWDGPVTDGPKLVRKHTTVRGERTGSPRRAQVGEGCNLRTQSQDLFLIHKMGDLPEPFGSFLPANLPRRAPALWWLSFWIWVSSAALSHPEGNDEAVGFRMLNERRPSLMKGSFACSPGCFVVGPVIKSMGTQSM